MSLVVLDSSAVVALLVDSGEAGTWVTRQLGESEIAGPELLAFEVANVLRRLAASRQISGEEATLSHADLLELRMQSWPYGVLAERVWKLRGALTAYDASYVAVAQVVRAPIVTLDARLARGGGSHCEIRCLP